jgi:phosphate-selective porin OprO/OprP
MRKALITGAAIVVAVLFCQSASAKSLEDILKEKGVITEQDYKEVTKVKPIDYKLGKGFTFTSQDEKFQLTIGGYLQPRYSFVDKDSNNTSASQRQDISEFRVRRAKFVLSGFAYTKDLTYKLQTEFAQSGNAKMLEDVWMNYKIIDEAQVRGGQDKVPFSRQWLISAWALSFLERSIASDAFYAGRDLGVMLNGKILKGLGYYTFGGFGGAGQTTLSNNNDNSFVARIVVNPLGDMPNVEADINMTKCPLVSIGANYYMGTFQRVATGGTNGFATNNVQFIANNVLFSNPSIPNGWLGTNAPLFLNTEKVNVNTFGVDVAFKWMGLAVQGEYYWAQGKGETSNKIVVAQGGYGQIGYMIIPKHLEAAFRYSIVDPNRGKSNDLKTETAGAVSYYFNNHYLKLQADVTDQHLQSQGQSQSSVDNMIYRMQAQVMF